MNRMTDNESKLLHALQCIYKEYGEYKSGVMGGTVDKKIPNTWTQDLAENVITQITDDESNKHMEAVIAGFVFIKNGEIMPENVDKDFADSVYYFCSEYGHGDHR